MQFRAKQIVPPKEWGTFEDLCHTLFKRVWNDSTAQKYGRRGQAQHGVDIFGSPKGDRRVYWGVQCKGKDRNYGGKAEWPEVLAEINKAENFSPQLDHWIFATTAPADAPLQKTAREVSVQRKAQGQFSVDVLGWEEIQSLMAGAPEVIAEFYPEHADHLPQVIEALRALPSLEQKLENLVKKLGEKLDGYSNVHGTAVWEPVRFNGNRGLGPALMGHALGPADAAACPQLNEVAAVLEQLKIAYSVRLIGEPGAGKSICSYQAAQKLAAKGYEVLRLIDPQADHIALERGAPGGKRLHLIDDAHLLEAHILQRIEQEAGPDQLVLTTHNAVEPANHRGAVTLDSKRAVKTIAAALRSDQPKTLLAVRIADDQVGNRMMEHDLGERIDYAEKTSDRPWQFCFVLGGGWRRSKQAADNARAAKADLILAAVAMRQMASRDARAVPEEIAEICAPAGFDLRIIVHRLEWLEKQRLIISRTDCRTPHQHFALVVLQRILEGQDEEGRKKLAAMIEGVLCDSRFPYGGLRFLIHELRFSGRDIVWKSFISQKGIEAAVARCWAAEGSDRNFAALALPDLWDFAEGGATAVVGPNVATLTKWISNPSDGAFGFGRLLNSLAQQDRGIAEQVVAAADSAAITAAYSNANPETAYGLAEFLDSIHYIDVDAFNSKIRASIDRDKLRELARHGTFLKDAYTFAKFCHSVYYWDQNLALDLSELFIPTAQQVLANDPVEGFHKLSMEFASGVLHVFDVLGVYVGKLRPTRRQLAIARRMCDKIDPMRVAKQIATTRSRHFQSAAYFLGFLGKVAPRKFGKVVMHLDWEKLDEVIGDDWANMPRETEMLLSILSSHPPTRHLVEKFIGERASRIVGLTPRLMLLAQDVGIAHVVKGGTLRLARYQLVDWSFGGLALAIVAQARPEMVEQTVEPFIDEIARGLGNYHNDYTGPSEGFIRTLIEHAPVAWNKILTKIDPATLEHSLAECLTKDEDHRRTAASVIESAITLEGPVGNMGRRFRERFPKTSLPATNVEWLRRRSRRRRKVKRVSD